MWQCDNVSERGQSGVVTVTRIASRLLTAMKPNRLSPLIRSTSYLSLQTRACLSLSQRSRFYSDAPPTDQPKKRRFKQSSPPGSGSSDGLNSRNAFASKTEEATPAWEQSTNPRKVCMPRTDSRLSASHGAYSVRLCAC
jgi:hypothetical protein